MLLLSATVVPSSTQVSNNLSFCIEMKRNKEVTYVELKCNNVSVCVWYLLEHCKRMKLQRDQAKLMKLFEEK